MFHPDGQYNPNYHTFDETLAYVATSFRASEKWTHVPQATAAIAAMKDLPPVKPEEPPKDEQGEYDALALVIWKEKMGAYMKSMRAYENQMKTGAACIFVDYCTPSMQTKLRGLADFHTDVELNPIEMLHRIRAIASHSNTHEHPIVRQVRRTQDAVSPKQRDNESTESYLLRVDGNLEQHFSFGGTDFILEPLKQTDEYKAALQADEAATKLAMEKEKGAEPVTNATDQLESAAINQYKAIVAWLGLQRGRYGDYQAQVEKAQAIDGTDLYPKSISALKETLSSNAYKPTKSYLDGVKSRQSGGSSNTKKEVDPNAVHHETGLKLPVLYQSKARGEGCFCCGNPNHKLTQ